MQTLEPISTTPNPIPFDQIPKSINKKPSLQNNWEDYKQWFTARLESISQLVDIYIKDQLSIHNKKLISFLLDELSILSKLLISVKTNEKLNF
ncbi:MAG: hypothetical protein ACFFA0_05110 [Promethearchaeota archaeon]